jgi:hypothetical protein
MKKLSQKSPSTMGLNLFFMSSLGWGAEKTWGTTHKAGNVSNTEHTILQILL